MNFEAALGALETAGVKFVIVGAYAAVVQGAGLATQDLDLCYERSPKNLKALASVLNDMHARLRGAPEGLPFLLDERTLAQGMNFTFETDFGDLDLLGELSGVGQYADLTRDAVILEIAGRSYQAASLDAIIRSKRAAGRPKDLNALPELEAIRGMAKKTKGQRRSKLQGRSCLLFPSLVMRDGPAREVSQIFNLLVQPS